MRFFRWLTTSACIAWGLAAGPGGLSRVSAQPLPAPAPQAVPPPPQTAAAATEPIRPGERIVRVVAPRMDLTITELQSRVVELTSRIRLVDDFNPQTLSISALAPNQLRIRAEASGVTTVRITDEFENVFHLEVFVEKDVRELQSHINRLFPGAAVEVVGVKDSIILRGWVTQPSQIPQIVELARTYSPSIQNHIDVGGGNQVQLSVKVLEVQRSKLEQFGFNFLAIGQNYHFASTPGNLVPVAAATLPFGGPPGVTMTQSALRNATMQFAILGSSDIFEGFIEALKQESLLKILARPTVATTSGRPAEIHSGGEFPILVPQGIGTATIQFRQFGIRMEAVPIVLGEGRVQLDVAAEVSERDFANAVDVNGFVVPGIISRDVNTRVEMKFGETLMIGGLTQDRVTASSNKIPFLGDIPYLGAAFSRKQHQIATTELVILVTPHLIAPFAPGTVPCGGPGLHSDDPTAWELLIDGHMEVPKFGPDCPQCPPGMSGMPGMIGPGAEMLSPAGSLDGYNPGVSPPSPPPSYPAEGTGPPGEFPGGLGANGMRGNPGVSTARTPLRDSAVRPASGVMGDPMRSAGAPGGQPGLIGPRSDLVRPAPQFLGGSSMPPR